MVLSGFAILLLVRWANLFSGIASSSSSAFVGDVDLIWIFVVLNESSEVVCPGPLSLDRSELALLGKRVYPLMNVGDLAETA